MLRALQRCQEVHAGLIGAAVEGPPEGTDSGADGREGVRERRGRHPRREGGGCEVVLGVED